MSPAERRQRLQQILDEENRAAARLRESLDASHEAGIHTRAGMLRIAEAHEAALEAITAMLAANQAVRALLNDEEAQ